ncbi:AAA family ATPase [Aeromonas enteropelogenes]|uniref:AAA family ATPase n=1 Tax=Aeromonas enteropelogenes TaxID=29489 RepID=A0ABU9J7F4_AEREN
MYEVKQITATNYKGFGHLELSIKPITVLLGANSCGKSSTINLVLMLTQSIDTQEEMLSPLRINGSLVGLGEPDNIIRNRNEENILGISISIDRMKDYDQSSDYPWLYELDTSRAEFLSYVSHFVSRLIQENSSLSKILSVKDIVSPNETDPHKIYNSISNTLKKVREVDKNSKLNFPHKGIKEYFTLSKFQRTTDILSIIDTIKSSSIKPKSFHYSIRLNKERKNKLSILSLKILNEHNQIILEISIPKPGGSAKITSDIIDNKILNNSKKDILENINANNLAFIKKHSERLYYSSTLSILTKNPVASFITWLIESCSYQLQQAMNKNNILHVSPLRAFPQRYYLLDKTILRTELDTANGTELAEILKRNTSILDRINKLLKAFDLKVRVDNINDVIHKITVVQDGVELEITDVGFGISQVIPILVQAFISPAGSITIVEQPEIHLHPKMQAWLTDALIQEALTYNKKFIIETHSEAIIRRIRRRVVERAFNLHESDVIIYDIQKDDNKCSFLNEIEIKPNGDIVWPEGFLDIEIEDQQSIQKAKRKMAMETLAKQIEKSNTSGEGHQ